VEKLLERISKKFYYKPKNQERSQVRDVYREWEYQRSKAYGPSDLAEIDAIFSRHLGK
jgi:archaellum biogenesis protein FlaJ (TadC family)